MGVTEKKSLEVLFVLGDKHKSTYGRSLRSYNLSDPRTIHCLAALFGLPRAILRINYVDHFFLSLYA